MRTTLVNYPILHRGPLGCGFLLLSLLGPACAQRGPELALSGGVSLAQPALRRHNLPRSFRTPAGFNTAATLRLTLPLTQRLGLGLEQRVTGLAQTFRYQVGTSRQSTGIGDRTVHQSGLSLRLYDVWTPGPRWGLDVALTGSYGWSSGWPYLYEGPLWDETPSSRPTPTAPVVSVKTRNWTGGPMAGVETLLRYEWGFRHSLLLSATYQRGLQQFAEIRSTRVEYVDEAGSVQQGSFVVRSYSSYATVQLGYGLRLGPLESGRNRTLRTPRYSLPPEEEEEPPTEPETER